MLEIRTTKQKSDVNVMFCDCRLQEERQEERVEQCGVAVLINSLM